MRLFSFRDGSQVKLGVLSSAAGLSFFALEDVAPWAPSNIPALLSVPKAMEKISAALATAPEGLKRSCDGLHYAPLIPQPGKLICMGLNYADHAAEGGHARPDFPSFFLRANSSLLGHGEALVRPRQSHQLDYEAELAVIIGQTVRHLSPDQALDCIAGYSLFNDGSIRDYQRKTSQWTIGKNFDATGPFGPWLVSADELPPGAAGLRIQSRLNGQVMQDANTSDFLFDVREALVLIAACMTLEPGDVIITGTPAGVGYARKPPVFMKAGDVCEIEVEGIGVLSNPVVDDVA
ncbi:MAG: FAA hydrolase family protein [Betaproteobacteria bacterium]|nr:FAA hydrolase family protein [Betaproteobacteria bacterium]